MMVEQMVNTILIKQGVEDSGSISASLVKQPIVAPKNIALRNVQNDSRTATSRPSSNFASQRETQSDVASTDAMPGGILSRPRHQSAGSPIANQQFVYARRKSDAELINGRNPKKHSRVNPQPEADVKEPNQRNASEFANIPVNSTGNPDETMNSWTDSLGKHDNGQPTISKSAPLDETRVRGKQHWRDRFVQLQTYLKQCNSNQEAYVKKLRSLTSDEASSRAVELERRAVQLMLEEGREIQRMRDLNNLRKQPANQSPTTTLFKSEK